MKCQKCDKPATFHITDLVDGKPNELHLCEECAHKFLAPSPDDASEVLPAMAGLLAQHLAVGETAEELARLDQRLLSGLWHHLFRIPQAGAARLPARLHRFRRRIRAAAVKHSW